ncbi:MAG: hypothetical protein AB9M60_18860 [Leptothrix sp. (in: b-proteobacteria)]
MCGVCGTLGGAEHWSSGAGRIAGFGHGSDTLTRRAERAERIRILNAVLRPLAVRVSDWQGRQYLVASPTGKHELVDSVAHVWTAVQAMNRGALARLDPLAGFNADDAGSATAR